MIEETQSGIPKQETLENLLHEENVFWRYGTKRKIYKRIWNMPWVGVQSEKWWKHEYHDSNHVERILKVKGFYMNTVSLVGFMRNTSYSFLPLSVFFCYFSSPSLFLSFFILPFHPSSSFLHSLATFLSSSPSFLFSSLLLPLFLDTEINK